MTISIRASDITERVAQAICGQLAESGRNSVVRTYTNYSPAAAQVTTVEITSASAQTYTLVINNVTVEVVADGGDTATTIAAEFVSKINAEPLIRGQVSASNAAGVITLTGTSPGVSFTVTESETDIGSPSTTTAAADAAAVGFGLAIMKNGFGSGSIDEAGQLGKKVATAAFTAQVVTITPSYVASAEYSLGVTFRGVTYWASTIGATDLDATIDALVAEINARLPASSVVAAANASTATAFTLTAEIVGEEFSVTFGCSDEGTGTPTSTIADTKGIATSLVQALAGVSLYALDEAASTVGSSDASYPAYAGMKVLEEGRVWVENTETLALGDAVYCDTATAKFSNATGSTKVLIPNYKWIRSSRSSDGLGLGLLECRA